MAVTQLHQSALPGMPRVFIAKDAADITAFTAQETITLTGIRRDATLAHVNRIVEPKQIKRIAEVE